MKRIESVLLDIDGTILDSNEPHAMAWQEFLAKKGHWLPINRLSWVIGMGGDKVLKELFGGTLDNKTAKKWGEERDELYLKKHSQRVKPLPGALEFLAQMRARGLRVAAATSATDVLLEGMLKQVPFDAYTVGISNADHVAHSKPSPDIFQAAIKKFGFDAARTVVIGDSPYDIQAAVATPCPAIAVRTGGFPYVALTGAVEIWKDIQALSYNMHRSLLAR